MNSSSNLLFFWSILLAVVKSSLQVNSSFYDSTQNIDYDIFLCRDKSKSIFLEYRCDGKNDCPDGSDERSCGCPEGGFRSSAGYCVPSVIYAIQHRHCHSKLNRRNCFKVCQYGQFRCSSSKCIAESKKCDGVADCDYSIDEWYRCNPKSSKITPHGCQINELPCYLKSGIRCAKFYEECLYYHECETDGCDPNQQCPSHQWRCFGGPCLQRNQLADGKVDCLAGADESPNALLFRNKKQPKLDFDMAFSQGASSSVYTFVKIMLSFFLVLGIGCQVYMMKSNNGRRVRRYFFKK